MSPPEQLSDRELERIFPGSSELATRMREFDWSASELGSPAGWPENLRIAVKLSLTSRFPILIWWGPRFTVLYNDAYIPFLGESKHPRFLGRPGREVWAEIWDTIGPMLEGVRATGEATWSDDFLFCFERKLAREEVHVRFTYSPILAADGRTVEGIFCPCTEITDEIVGARRLETLGKLGARPAEARSTHAACAEVARVLSENPYDVPFAAIYARDEGADDMYLVASAGLSKAHPLPLSASTARVDVPSWPLAEALRLGQPQEVDGLATAGLPGGPWPEPTNQAMVLPIGGQNSDVAGLLVAGISPRRVWDDAYRTFFGLVAAHIGTALAHANAYETERRRAEALAELDRAKTIFFSNVSHEFRAPLTLMLGPIEDALADGAEPLPARQRERLEIAHRASLRLLKLVNTLLDFSRIEAGRMQAVYVPTDLAALTAELASHFHSVSVRAGVRLVVDCPPLPEPVYVDRDMWEKIVFNLLSNAFKFTLEGEIEVRLRSDDGAVELSVRDTGAGIVAGELPHIFERFYRVAGSRSRTQEGTGIGLSLVEEMVRLNGGSVRVESILGQGSTFIVTVLLGTAHLPADRIGQPRTLGSAAVGARVFLNEALRWLPHEEAPRERTVAGSETAALPAEAAAPRSRLGEEPGGPVARRPRIVWADDNADMRQYVRRLLSERYDVHDVPDGAAAVLAARAQRPDLVLADVMMPRLDGFGLLRALREDPRTRTIPVILLSARAGEESQVEGLEAGADDYLVKPFGARELLARVRTHIEMSRLREESSRRERELLAETQAAHRRLAAVLQSISDGFIALDHEWRYTAVNDRACESMGMSRGEILGRSIWELSPDTIGTQFEVELRRAAAEQKPSVFPFFYPTRSRWYENHLYPSADGLTIFSADITERKRAEELLAAELAGMQRLQSVSTLMVDDGEPHQLLQEIVDAAIAITASDMGNIQLLDEGSRTLRIVASRGFEAPFFQFFEAVQEGQGACGSAMQRGERVIVDDVITSPMFTGTPERDVLLAANVRSVQSTPLTSRVGRLVGMLSTHYRVPRRPESRDLHILDLLARQAADWIERVSADEALRESEARFRNMADHAPLIIWVTDSVGNCTYLNEGWRRFTGTTPAEGLGYGWAASIHPDDREATLKSFRGAIERREAIRLEYRLRRYDGAYRWAIDAAAPRFGAAGELLGYMGSVLDVTEEKDAEAKLRQARDELDSRVHARTAELSEALVSLERQDQQRKDLLRQIVTVQEEERGRIARELHDQMGQHLTALSLRLQLALDSVGENATAREQLLRLDEYTDYIGTQVHRIALELRPTALDDLGLLAALNNYVAEWSHDFGVDSEVRSSGMETERLPSPIETTIYRAVQEAMTNVAKHAEATRVIVTLSRLSDYISVIVEDNGKGFDVSPAMNPAATSAMLGLLGMRERVALVDGRLEIESTPGGGTSVLIRIPIPGTEEVEAHA